MLLPSTFLSQTSQTQERFQKISSKSYLFASGGAFITIFSSIVLFSSCLCFALPGINVIRSIVLPGILPASIGFLASIPLFYHAYALSKVKRTLRRQLVDSAFNHLNENTICQETNHKQIKKYFNESFFIQSSWIYKNDFLTELKNRAEKGTPLMDLLDTAIAQFAPGKPQKKDKT